MGMGSRERGSGPVGARCAAVPGVHSARKHLPGADRKIVFDQFHIAKHRAAAVDGAIAGRIPPYAAMLGHLRQGNADRALHWFERMYASHGGWLITAKVNPMFDPLRREPRARTVLAGLHLL